MYIQITIGIFFGLAIISTIARVGFRIHVHRSLSLYSEDYITLIGAMCLCAATGILYKKCDYLFLIDVLGNDPSLVSNISPDQISDLLKTPYAVYYAFYALIWTTTFAVKLSFLVFFKRLINGVTKIHKYYWIVGMITLLSWLYNVTEPFVVCSHPNESIGEITHALFNFENANST